MPKLLSATIFPHGFTEAYPAFGPALAVSGDFPKQTPPPPCEYGTYFPFAAAVANRVPAQPCPATFAALLGNNVGISPVICVGDNGILIEPPLCKGIIYIYYILNIFVYKMAVFIYIIHVIC